MAVKRKYRLNLRNYGNLPAIMLSQYDEGYALEFEIRDGTEAASDLSAYTVTLKGTRADTLAYSFAGTISTNVLTFVIDTTMTACAGRGTAEIAIKDTANDVLFATFNMPVFVERAAVPEGSIDADVERAQEIAEQIQEIVDNAAAAVSGEAEKWATGQIDGTDVPSTDPAYENNAKYYAEQAADSAASIGIDATLTQAGKAADAKKTGDEISELKSDLSNVIIYPNLVNPSECTIGKYLPPNSTSKAYSTYDFTNPITVTPGEILYLTHEARFLQARNASNQRIDDAGLSSGFTQYTVPEGVAIVYITFYHSDFSDFMVSKYPNLGYVPYGEKAINEQYISSLIQMQEQIEDNTNEISAIQQITSKTGGYYRLTGDITANGHLLIDKMLSVQKNVVLSFVGNIGTTFAGIEIGFTTDITQSDQEHFIITDTEITRVTTSPTTAQHGITIKDQICVTITNTIDGYLKVKIESNGQSYTSSNAWRTSSRKPYVKALGNMTDCVFTWTCNDNSKDIALFGDSYLSFSNERWRYYLDADGYSDNTFVNSYAGENSANGVINFDNLMPVISPRFLFWGYGMNDHDSGGVYNASWKTALDHVLEYCDNHGITPILATIPNVPQYDNTAKNTYIRNSGRRYIDFAKAVGSDISSAWFDGMLSSDNVHPTALGAIALYHRAIVDFPELAVTN